MTEAARPIAIVTGGRRGIGLGIVRALAQSGFDIAITGLEDSDAESSSLIDELGDIGASAIYVQSDLADLAGHQRVVDLVTGSLGPIACLVNNAGMASVVRGDFLEMKPENFDRILSVNLRGTVFFTQAVARSMLAGGAGTARSIITISSVSAEMASPDRIDYCISKAALAAFSRSLALRLAEPGIAVFEIRPGIIRSDMTAKVSEKYDRLIGEGLVPAGRWGEAEDVGKAVAALAGGAFAFSSGSVIHVDGALSVSRL
ncbi:NAD(P)-dependent dehydrogenase (short-subunit alcohol dehydrogenase family) [Hoeflea marina]|uniref:NAD(P)-dependent dehydrogenase (Short-subunit alcohol dehydrogenase family) n=1 Tax=Hoeflea marina TaxID=274592 RepID=A0A317PSW0_9HYPH|nr:3-ketoacyl-ACP reductase [Hoeflea marina]PWW04553.1 NAD(P)-dependent dehydrogenase (short-subunit alcohol dehydrogenase family) [Hoeflea marina]